MTLEDANVPLPPGPPATITTFLLDEDHSREVSYQWSLMKGSYEVAGMQPNRTFTLTGMFGRRVLDVVGVPESWYVKTIGYGGKEVIDGAVEFKAPEQTLEVVLSNRGAVVNGTVMDDAGAPVSRAEVYLFRRGASVSPNATTASASGTFTLGPVRDGDFEIVALPAGTPRLQQDDWNRRARLVSLSERLTLADLDKRTIRLRVSDER